MKKKANAKKFKLKPIFMAFALMATSSVFSFAACTTDDDDDDDETAVAKTDVQLIKNGNFEFYSENSDDDDEGIYYISSVNNWSNSSLGTPSSDVMSGIIGTGKTAWTGFTDLELAETLDINNDLDSDDDDYEEKYLDFNGLESSDLPFKATDKALVKDDDGNVIYENITAADFIENPGAVIYTNEDNIGYYDQNGDFVKLYENNGYYYTDAEFTEEYDNHVLMVHNYTYTHTDGNDEVIHNGTAQKYKSSTTVTLEANTAAEISVWVKTSNLVFNNGNTVHQDRGAFIEVEQTVGGTALDSMKIKNIDTEKLTPADAGDNYSNGWYKYTVYVQACDFASTTVTLSLGLGESGGENYVEGYAFFDDVKMTKYTNLGKTSYADNQSKITEATTCSLTDEADEKEFIANPLAYGENAPADRNSKDFYYLLDLTSAQDRVDVTTSNAIYEAGLTVDANKFCSSNAGMPTIYGNYVSEKTLGYTPYYPSFKTIDTSDDVISALKVATGDDDSVKTNIKNSLSGSDYADDIANVLYSAQALPGVDGSTDALVMLSARGAAYTTTLAARGASDIFNVPANSYKIVSFWVKTSDMDGSTAATLAISDVSDKTNKQTFTVDTTDITFDLDDENEDVYNGWVQCFFFVDNDTDEEQTFKIDFSFGNTTIKNTSAYSYKYGYAMLANLQTFEVDEDEFALIGSNSYSASLSFSESKDTLTGIFDEVYSGLNNDLETTVAAPTSYNTVLGEGKNINKDNTSFAAGLVNKENFIEEGGIYDTYLLNSGENKYAWLRNLANSEIESVNNIFTAAKTAEEIWESLFGSKAVQPLIITNSVRTYVENDEQINFANVGYVGETSTLTASGVVAVSYRVKVSEGAVAYIYLTDGKDVLSYNTAKYTFWYDDDGNVLKEEPSDSNDYDAVANIAYKVRIDGLFESTLSGDDKLYANLYNYNKYYTDEKIEYYDANGNSVHIDDIYKKPTSEIYYTSKTEQTESTIATHYLVAENGTEITRLYKWVTEEQSYYYIEGNETTKKVEAFDTKYARYGEENAADETYLITVDGNDANVANKWVTVNFYLCAGSASKTYRVELWNGERLVSGVNGDDVDSTISKQSGIATASQAGSYIVFDYSINSLDASTFATLKDEKENQIKNYYKNLVMEAIESGKNIEIASNDETIDYYKQLAIENNLINANAANYIEYNAIYNTYSLYDSTAYIPYNEETANDNDTKYEYNVADYEETLAYLSTKETVDGVNGKELAYTVFADYSTVDQSITREIVEDEEDEEDEETDLEGTSVWLLVSSILLVVALLVAIVSVGYREFVKKHGKIQFGKNKKLYAKNQYNSSKRKRYIKKLKLEDESLLSEEQSEENAEPETQSEKQNELTEEVNEQVEEQTVEESNETDETPDGK